MTALAEPTIEEPLDDTIFSADTYMLNVPQMDGHRAVTLELRLSGAALLDRASEDDLALLEAARLGEQVRLIVVGEFSGKGFRLKRNTDGDAEVAYACTVKVLSVEAGEIA